MARWRFGWRRPRRILWRTGSQCHTSICVCAAMTLGFFLWNKHFFVFRFGNNICCWDFVVKNRVGPIWCFFFFSQDFLPGSINFRRKMASSSRKGMDFEGFGPRILRHRHRQWKLIARSNPPKMTQTPSIYSWHCPHAAITDRWEGRSLADRGKTGEKKWGVGKNLE